ncbi:TPA: hypothetical protein ACSPK2_001147 [Pseudomonas aeruginosa]|uniref:hypothetical protein n=1 Tax=Sphingobium sp. TaxID=1912891 RepID=UPI00261B3FBF|nr:hypothetical protein [Sphingobium sp.]
MLVSSSEIGQRAMQHRNVINAAKTAGLKRIVQRERSCTSKAASSRASRDRRQAARL